MKKSTLILLSLIAFELAYAQPITVNISMTMNARPVANISNWAIRNDVLMLTASPTAIGPYPGKVKINSTIKTADGATVAVTDMQLAKEQRLAPFTVTTFYAKDVVDMQAMVFTGSYQNKLNRTGKLAAGNYQIIVHLDSVNSPIKLSNEVTKLFFLSATQLPVLMMPADGATLKADAAQTAITFRWTPVSPKPAENVRYHVQVFEVLDYQTPMQALRSNMPLLDKEVIGSTQYIWQPQLSFIDSTHKKFIWTIQSFDYLGQIITGETANGEGRSEARTFIIGGMKNKRPEKETGKTEPEN